MFSVLFYVLERCKITQYYYILYNPLTLHMKRENTGNKKWFAFDICSNLHFSLFFQSTIGFLKLHTNIIAEF